VGRRRFTFARGPYFNVVICALEIVIVVIVIVVVVVVCTIATLGTVDTTITIVTIVTIVGIVAAVCNDGALASSGSSTSGGFSYQRSGAVVSIHRRAFFC